MESKFGGFGSWEWKSWFCSSILRRVQVVHEMKICTLSEICTHVCCFHIVSIQVILTLFNCGFFFIQVKGRQSLNLNYLLSVFGLCTNHLVCVPALENYGLQTLFASVLFYLHHWFSFNVIVESMKKRMPKVQNLSEETWVQIWKKICIGKLNIICMAKRAGWWVCNVWNVFWTGVPFPPPVH